MEDWARDFRKTVKNEDFLEFQRSLFSFTPCIIIIQWFPNCESWHINQNSPFQTVKIFLSKLSKFTFSNCQNFPFQTVKIFLLKLSKFSFSNCQNFPFETDKIFLSKLSKLSFSNCQNFPSQTVKILLFKLSIIFLII